MKTKIFITLTFSFILIGTFAQPKVKKTENVVYGMISGMALLMDVYQPENSNGMGVVVIYGSAFGYFGSYQRVYNQIPLKDDYTADKKYAAKWSQELVNKGYTLFVINHRFSPRFKHGEILEDSRRAVRFIRYNAKTYKINPNKIGAIGQSSGGHLSALLGSVDTPFENVNKNPVDSVSSKVQAVVSMAGPMIKTDLNTKQDTISDHKLVTKIILNLFGELPDLKNGEFVFNGKFAEASPINHITKNDAPMLLYHSEDDNLIPYRHAVKMNQKLIEMGVETKLIIQKKTGHNAVPDIDEVDAWFKMYLK